MEFNKGNQLIIQSIIIARRNLVNQLEGRNLEDKSLIQQKIRILDSHLRQYLSSDQAVSRPNSFGIQSIKVQPTNSIYSKSTVAWAEFIAKKKLEYKKQLKRSKIIENLQDNKIFVSYIRTRKKQHFKEINLN